jgi:hypothetical protein
VGGYHEGSRWAMHSLIRGQGARFRPKTQNQAIMAQFQARCMEQQCRVVPGGGGCRLILWGWRVCICKCEVGFGPKT